MCSVIILRRPQTAWPVMIGANRDEMAGRPWRAPGRHWPDRPNVVAGIDLLAGGSWLGLNDEGVVAAVLNREGTLGPADGRRSRGELVLEALDHDDAAAAAEALEHLDTRAYRPFNLMIADDRDAFCLSHRGNDAGQRLRAEPIPVGVSMITAVDRDDPRDPRLRFYRPQFAAATPPEPETDSWTAWEALLARPDAEPGADTRGAMCFQTPSGFGTSSSSLIALPNRRQASRPARWRFAAGRPGETPWQPVAV
ncbi:MAG: hypothetical protein GC191_06335 [Azospirillum sp.]|nr:hypothetical protein [Azospirillum sp.]